MKRCLIILFFIIMLLTPLLSCREAQKDHTNTTGIKIIATLFPLYDFARYIVGDKGYVEMLLPPGAEPHSFEPKPADIARLQKTDVFIYTGRYMEVWVDRMLSGIDNKDILIIDTSRGLNLIRAKKDNSQHQHRDQHSSDTERGAIDPHVWLDFQNAVLMVDNIYSGLSKKGHADYFRKNAEALKARLLALDEKYREALADCSKDTFISGGHLTFGYLAKRYNLKYFSAYGLSPDSEPSARTIADISRQMKRDGLRHIFFEELLQPRVAETISRETGAQLLMLRGAHNLSKDEFLKGVDFFSIMEENLINLKKGLQCRQR